MYVKNEMKHLLSVLDIQVKVRCKNYVVTPPLSQTGAIKLCWRSCKHVVPMIFTPIIESLHRPKFDTL